MRHPAAWVVSVSRSASLALQEDSTTQISDDTTGRGQQGKSRTQETGRTRRKGTLARPKNPRISSGRNWCGNTKGARRARRRHEHGQGWEYSVSLRRSRRQAESVLLEQPAARAHFSLVPLRKNIGPSSVRRLVHRRRGPPCPLKVHVRGDLPAKVWHGKSDLQAHTNVGEVGNNEGHSTGRSPRCAVWRFLDHSAVCCQRSSVRCGRRNNSVLRLAPREGPWKGSPSALLQVGAWSRTQIVDD